MVLYFTVFSCQMVVYLLSTFNGRPLCLTTKRHVMRIDQSQRSLAIGHMIISEINLLGNYYCLVKSELKVFKFGQIHGTSNLDFF